MLISKNLHKKSNEVSIKTGSTPASLSFIGQVTKHTTVKWSFAIILLPVGQKYLRGTKEKNKVEQCFHGFLISFVFFSVNHRCMVCQFRGVGHFILHKLRLCNNSSKCRRKRLTRHNNSRLDEDRRLRYQLNHRR